MSKYDFEFKLAYGVIYESFDELKQAVDKYIYYYNNKRLKAKLTGMSPIEYRKQASQLVA